MRGALPGHHQRVGGTGEEGHLFLQKYLKLGHVHAEASGGCV